MQPERTRLSIRHEHDKTIIRVADAADDSVLLTLNLSPEDVEWLRSKLFRHKTLPPLANATEGKRS